MVMKNPFPNNLKYKNRKVNMSYNILWDEDFDDYEWMYAAKGWCGITVWVDEEEISLIFYDPVRLLQEVNDELKRIAFFRENNLVVVEVVNRKNIEAAFAKMFDERYL
jgi:hypothetical protein